MRNYRIVRIAPASFRSAIESFYRDRPELRRAPYAEQQAAFFAAGYIYADSFARAMRTLGHEAHEILCNFEQLQKTWAREHGCPAAAGAWQPAIVGAQLRALRPDVVYVQGLGILPPAFLNRLKEEVPSVRLLVQYTCYPGAADELRGVDLFFAGTPTMARQYAAAGFPTRLLYHAFDETVLPGLPPAGAPAVEPAHDFTFAGSSGFAQGLAHQARYWMLRELMERTPLRLWVDEEYSRAGTGVTERVKAVVRGALGAASRPLALGTLEAGLSAPGMPAPAKRVLRSMIYQRTEAQKRHEPAGEGAARTPSQPLGALFPGRCAPPVFGVEMLRVLAASRVTFNKHTDAALGDVGNIRLFQATGVGACLLTDRGRNLPELFEEDREVVTYRGTDECAEKLGYLLAHEAVRAGIARAGQRRTLREHTTLNRCRQIDEAIQGLL